VDDRSDSDVGTHSPSKASTVPVARLGCIIPRRLARRAVTRALVRRQAREVARRAQAAVPVPAWWVLRLAAPLRRDEFRSATSPALRRLVRCELDAAFGSAVEAWPGRAERRSGHDGR
jgi:ribonuclease P protein component